MPFFSDDSFHNVLSFALFSICAGLVAALVWVLLRRLRRQRQMCDQETMTVEPSAKQGSILESGAGASHKESVPQMPGLDTATHDKRKQSAGEGQHQAASGSPTKTAAAESAKTSPPGAAERVAEAESKEQSVAAAAGSPGDSRQASVLTNKSKKRRHSESKKSPESSSAAKADGKGRRSSVPSKTASKTGSKAGSKAGSKPSSKPSSRRGSMQHSKTSPSKESAGAVRKSSSSELPGVPALLIRRPSTSSKSSQRSNRSTRYVRESPKVDPPLDVFSREHSSMAESPPSQSTHSPPQAVVVTEPAKPPEAPHASSSKTEGSEKPRTEATTDGGQ